MVILKCSKCKKEKPQDSFKDSSGEKRYKKCIDCRVHHRNYCKQRLEKPEIRQRQNNLKKERYYKYLDSERETRKMFMRKKRADPIRRRQMMANHLKKKYDLSLEEYDRMLESQNNQCAICKKDFPESFQMWNRPCVDHCHRTNKVRGILCRFCNISLHYIENFNYWESAKEYLRLNGAEDKEPLT